LPNRNPEPVRCAWCGTDPEYVAYHDREWGVPSHDDRHLFEMLILEGAQAGLSWLTILRKRPAYRAAFAGFDPARVAAFGEADIERLLGDAGIVRNRAKIEAAIGNARAVRDLQARHDGFAGWLWGFVDGQQRVNRPPTAADVPTETAESRALSKALRAAGCRFVGPTICYAYMQAVGLVDDHVADCVRARAVAGG
jgi:DNA-3-methyladenine glycosylase I